MKEKERISPTGADEISLVFGYGILIGIREMINQMEYTPEDREKANRMFYDQNIKPMADIVRRHFNITNAVSFDPATLEIIIFEEQGEEVGYHQQP